MIVPVVFTLLGACALARPGGDLKACGDAYYSVDKYTCYDGDFLCPVIDGEPTLRCGPDCYLPEMYSCDAGELVYPPTTSSPGGKPSASPSVCPEPPTTQQLSDAPYENYFYSDCHSASQVVVTSPLVSSNLTIIGPRLLVAWPAGNSGLVSFFQPQSGVNGSLAIALENGASMFPLHGVYIEPEQNSPSGLPYVGVSTLVSFNTSAVLTVPILGSIRNIRDFTEGPSLLVPLIQDALEWSNTSDGGVMISRPWLDNMTTTWMSFTSVGDGDLKMGMSEEGNKTIEFQAGTYNFTAAFDYPQLTQLNASTVLNPQSQGLIMQESDEATSLSFLSYSDKLLAGAWRFLTYFGRDSMIAALLLQPVLSEGEGGAIEAVIGAVLERLNRTSGIVCHEETIGDYSIYLNLMKNITSTAPGCTYQMVDTDYYLAPLMENYFLNTETGRNRKEAFFATKATLDFGNKGLTYGELALINLEAVMNKTAPYAQPGGQTIENLIHLEENELVGEWRDSTYGLGGGRIPYDVNTALVPAALHSIAALSAAAFFPQHPTWLTTARAHARVWESTTLPFFALTIPAPEARALVDSYTAAALPPNLPSGSETITDPVTFHALALQGNNAQPLVRVMHTDTCFRLFPLPASDQPASFLNETATNLRAPFPVGLSSPVGLFVANPAYGGDDVYAANFTNAAYHGTVVWSWQLAMMAAGLERQLVSCAGEEEGEGEFCGDEGVRGNVGGAYNHLWDLIEANEAIINSEVWSWVYRDGEFVFEPLGALPPPAGVNPTESNVRQLWSLTWLAVKRNEALR